MSFKRTGVLLSSIVLGVFVVTACAVRKLEITPIEAAATETITVSSPVKAHLTDGSTVVFEEGITVAQGTVTGEGYKYDLTLKERIPVSAISLNHIAAMESYQTPLQKGESVAGTVFATPFALLGGTMLAIALFGSCPTTYSLSDGQPVLEAESFSYSIASGYEARDVDRLNVPAGDLQTVDLIIRNEALETHYINHVELLEVVHDHGRTVVPDPQGRPLEVGAMTPPDMALDREHRRVTDLLASADERSWHSSSKRLGQASLQDFQDYIDLEFEAPRRSDRVALVFRLRNTLLNTVLLYDVMLKEQGFRALDWLGDDLNRFINKAKLGLWYRDRMGMRISVFEDGGYREVARVGDQGPIAWKDIAVTLPVPDRDRIRVRLSFVVDNWHIDQVAMSPEVRRPDVRAVPLARIEGSRNDPLHGALQNLSMSDKRYVVTRPGETLHVGFDVGTVPDGRERTFLMAAQGYYIEWMRRAWLSETPTEPFKPSDRALLRAIRLWEAKRDRFQKQFESSRIATP